MVVHSAGLSNSGPYADPSIIVSPASEHDSARGRRRDRSVNRGAVRGLRCAPTDESSTLRGRSRRRATSPASGYAPGASSPRVLSPTRRRLLQARLRREHCPSRVASPAALRRRQRTRSRSRGPNVDNEQESSRLVDGLSSLRNELLAPDQSDQGTPCDA